MSVCRRFFYRSNFKRKKFLNHRENFYIIARIAHVCLLSGEVDVNSWQKASEAWGRAPSPQVSTSNIYFYANPHISIDFSAKHIHIYFCADPHWAYPIHMYFSAAPHWTYQHIIFPFCKSSLIIYISLKILIEHMPINFSANQLKSIKSFSYQSAFNVVLSCPLDSRGKLAESGELQVKMKTRIFLE